MKFIKKIFKLLFWLAISFFIYSILIVVIYKWVPPPFTPFMIIRFVEGFIDGKPVGIDKIWEPYDEVSGNFFRAVVSGEDARFMQHNGIDWKAVKAAQRFNELHEGDRLHGASTISMQTARNAFLWHGRNYLRKGLEVYFTYLIEIIWGKKRILEVYVNIVELGKGVYGVEAASEAYFHKPAKELTRHEAALLAAILPNPRHRNPAHPSDFLEQRARFIQGRMGSVAIPK